MKGLGLLVTSDLMSYYDIYKVLTIYYIIIYNIYDKKYYN